MSNARVFTVRVWCQARQFRASLRAVGDEEALLFTAPAPLADYLLGATAAAAFDGAAPEAAPPAGPTPPKSAPPRRWR